VLSELGCHVTFISGGELEGPNAGEPARLIRSRYIDCALRRGHSGNGLVALILNDIDVAIGDWGAQVQYTVNRQIVLGELMHLADYPTMVENRRVPRVPIILTGNDFTRLYGPATRAGRMRSFTWIPSLDEKTEMLTGLFPELTMEECQTLIGEFSGQPMAFFSQIRSQLTDDSLWSYMEHTGLRTSFCQIALGDKLELASPVTLRGLLATGYEMIRVGELVNHM
jgi:hypothetical protein